MPNSGGACARRVELSIGHLTTSPTALGQAAGVARGSCQKVRETNITPSIQTRATTTRSHHWCAPCNGQHRGRCLHTSDVRLTAMGARELLGQDWHTRSSVLVPNVCARDRCSKTTLGPVPPVGLGGPGYSVGQLEGEATRAHSPAGASSSTNRDSSTPNVEAPQDRHLECRDTSACNLKNTSKGKLRTMLPCSYTHSPQVTPSTDSRSLKEG